MRSAEEGSIVSSPLSMDQNVRGRQIAVRPTRQLIRPEPVFLNVYGAQESIPRNEFRKPM